jgi:hypothetical protein
MTTSTGSSVHSIDQRSSQERLPYLDTGIVDILTRHLGGVGVVLEHRYYGEYGKLF